MLVGNQAKFIWHYCVDCAVPCACDTPSEDINWKRHHFRPLKMKVFNCDLWLAQRKSKYGKPLFFVTNYRLSCCCPHFEENGFICCYFIWVLSLLIGPCHLSEFTLTGLLDRTDDKFLKLSGKVTIVQFSFKYICPHSYKFIHTQVKLLNC